MPASDAIVIYGPCVGVKYWLKSIGRHHQNLLPQKNKLGLCKAKMKWLLIKKFDECLRSEEIIYKSKTDLKMTKYLYYLCGIENARCLADTRGSP